MWTQLYIVIRLKYVSTSLDKLLWNCGISVIASQTIANIALSDMALCNWNSNYVILNMNSLEC